MGCHPCHFLHSGRQNVQTCSQSVETRCASLQTGCGNEEVFCMQTMYASIVRNNYIRSGTGSGRNTDETSAKD